MGQRKTPASWPGASDAPSERIPIDTNYPGFRCAHPGLSYNAASRLKARPDCLVGLGAGRLQRRF